MNESSFAKLAALEAKNVAQRKLLAIDAERARRVTKTTQVRIDRNHRINKSWWWWPWKRPVDTEGVTEELDFENFGLGLCHERTYADWAEDRCRDVISLAEATCDGFVWLSPTHVRALFCKV